MIIHTMPLRSSLAVLAAAALLVLSGPAAAVDPAAASASAPTSASLQARVNSLVGDAGCDAQEQCRVIGIGAKPCGGPESWLAWSTRKTDPQALQDAAQAHAEARAAENKRSGLASDCMMRPQPTAVCRPRAGDGKKTCQLGQGGVGSPV